MGRAPNKVLWNMKDCEDYLDLARDELDVILRRAETTMDTTILRAASLVAVYLSKIQQHVGDAKMNVYKEPKA